MKLRFRLLDNDIGWALEDHIGNKLGEFTLPPTDSHAYRACALYGLKQWVADGGAKEEGTPLRVRVAGMADRYRAIVSGELTLRGGRGGAARMPDAIIYNAAVGAGLMADSDAMRKAWAAASPAARAKVAADPRVVAYLERNSPDDAGDALADILAAAGN